MGGFRLNRGSTRCKKCGKEIRFIRTTSGKYMPCDTDFVYYKEKPEGKDRIVLPNGQIVAGEILKGPEDADGFGYISHFATCEFERKFRRKKSS